jgi:hypothetical protein
VTDASMREALDAVLHGAEPKVDAGDRGPSAVAPLAPGDEGRSVADASPGASGAWEAILRSEETRWQRYGHPCVAVQIQVVGGRDLTTHLGAEAGARVRATLERLLASAMRASDHFEFRHRWQLVALLPETDEAGATVALDRLQRAFAEAMGPALAVSVAYGLAAPGPGGTMSVAFHQAGQDLVARRRRDRPSPGDGQDDTPRASATGGPPERSDEPDLRVRLDALASLLAGGQISEAEYTAKRTEILDLL